MRSEERHFLLALVLASLAFSTVSLAQVTTANIYGTVQDSTGAVIPSATVTITNQGTGATVNRETDSGGDFAFEFLRVASYRIKIEAKGFKTLESTDIELRAGANIRRAFNLEVGALTETVSVEGTAPLVNAVSAEQSQDVSRMEAAELPLPKRNISNLLGLGTGVTGGGDSFRLNGVGKTGTLYTVDGTNASADPEGRTIAQRGNFENITLLSLEGVQQVETTKGIMPAEFGQALGGSVNIITRSGTNIWHGSVFENFQSDNLNAKSRQLARKVNTVFNQFGGSVGGPIVRDRVFIFADYEGYRQSVSQTLRSLVPTAEFRQQMITAQPSYSKYLDTLPLPNESYAAGSETAYYTTGAAQTAHDNHVDVKGDIRLGGTGSLALTFSHGRPDQSIPRINPDHLNDQVFHGFTDRGTLSYVTAGPSWSSETRFGYSLNDMDRTDAYFLIGIGDKTPFGGREPSLVYTSFSTPSTEVWLEEGKTWSLEEKYARIAGKHSLKFGGIYMRFNVYRNNPENPKLSYSSEADLLANISSQLLYTFGNGSYDGAAYVAGGFIQDNWRTTNRLTINMGVRYDYSSKFVATSRVSQYEYGLYNFDGLLDSQFHFGPLRDPKDPYESDGWVNLAPRLGFSYDVTGKSTTTIRGGLGVMFSPMAIGAFSGAVGGKYVPFRSTLSRQEGLDLGLTFPSYNDTMVPILNARAKVLPTVVYNPNLRMPYVLAKYFGIQHALSSTLVLETAYVGNRGIAFNMNRTFNQPDRVTGIRPNPDLGGQGYYLDNSQLSTYHSWQMALRQRLSQGVTGAIRYTYGKQLATDSGDIGAYYQNNANVRAQDFFNLKSEWARADGDTRHYLSTDWVYQAPALRSLNAVARQILGGWQVSGILSITSGQPVVLGQGGGEDTSRPDALGGNPYTSDYEHTFQYLNKAVFATVPIGSASGRPIRPGTLGRNVIEGFGNWNVDFSLGKNFKLSEKAEFQVRMDAFNALNHTGFGGFQTNIFSSSFGRITSYRGPRVAQLNARLTW